MSKPENVSSEILSSVAPCSMFCSTCTGYKNGEISFHAQELLKLLNGYKEFLEKNLKDEYKYKLDEFITFEKSLKKYDYPKCGGCRNGGATGCSIKGCFISKCTKEHKVNYCGECDLFPCGKVNNKVFKDTVIKKWYDGSMRIQEIGISSYYEEKKNTSHYTSFKK